MKSIKLHIAELLLGKIEDSAKQGFWLVSELVKKHKFFLLLLLVVGVFVGLIEGASIGLLAFSVVVITGETSTCLDFLVSISNYFPVDLCKDYNKYDMFGLIIVSSVFVQIIKSITVCASNYLGIILNTRISYEMQIRVFTHMLRLNYQDVNQYSVGERQHIFGSAHVFSKLALAINELIIIFFVLSTYFFILVTMNWKLTMISIVLLIVLVLFVLPFLERIRQLGKAQRDTGILIGRRVIDYFFAVRLIKLYERSEEVIGDVKHIIARRIGLVRSMSLFQNAIPNIQETILVVSVSLILLGGVYFAGDEAENVLPQILAYILVLYRCNSRVVSLNSIRASLSGAIAPLVHITDFLSFGSIKDRSTQVSSRVIDPLWKKLSIENLSFQYGNQSKYVLDNVNLDIYRGQKVAFVGQSGSGKSTLVDLIVGLIQPSKGKIKIDEFQVNAPEHSNWISQFSMVSQNDLILDGSVMDNLLFADSNATREQVIKACKLADAHEFIEKLDNGYDSILGERGYKVSGGQIQRIAFARALLKNAPVLVLDEATSALDNIVERKIIDQLLDEDSNRTMIMIAHRLSTVMDVDIIYVFEQGKVVDSGTHKELLSRPGLYRSLWHSTEESS